VDLVALAPERRDWNEPEDPQAEVRVQAVCSLFGPTELGSLVGGIQRASRNAWVGPLLGRVPAMDPKNVEAASPIHYVTRSAPPFLLMHGEKDWFVPPQQSESLADKLFELGVPVTYLLVPERGHGFQRGDYEVQARSFFNGWLKSR
jgi:acetyl esterase/lipase